MTRSQITKMAHDLKQAYRCTWSVAMRMAWGAARGFTHAYEAVFVDGAGKVARREVFLGNSSDEATAARQVAQKRLSDEGLRFLGGHGTNLSIRIPAPAEVPKPVVRPSTAYRHISEPIAADARA